MVAVSLCLELLHLILELQDLLLGGELPLPCGFQLSLLLLLSLQSSIRSYQQGAAINCTHYDWHTLVA